jgi:hypothetical protein
MLATKRPNVAKKNVGGGEITLIRVWACIRVCTCCTYLYARVDLQKIVLFAANHKLDRACVSVPGCNSAIVSAPGVAFGAANPNRPSEPNYPNYTTTFSSHA